MKSLLIVLALVVACGNGEFSAGSNSTATTTTQPEATQLELLSQARALWDETRPDDYVFKYHVFCECFPGPWTLHVTGSDAVSLAD